MHDEREIVYVGKAVDQTIGARLKQHTVDRHASRWIRFSWYGFKKVLDNATIEPLNPTNSLTVTIEDMASFIEGLLIEAIQPRSHRQAGKGFRVEDFEYIQLNFKLLTQN